MQIPVRDDSCAKKGDQLGVGQPVPGVGTATTPSKSRRFSSLLEQKLQTELHHARRHRRRRDDAEGRGRVQVISGGIELSEVEYVKRIQVELQASPSQSFVVLIQAERMDWGRRRRGRLDCQSDSAFLQCNTANSREGPQR